MIGQVYLAAGDLAAAAEMLAPAFAEQTPDSFYEVNAARVLPALLLARGEHERAAQSAADYLARLRGLQVRLNLPDLLLVLGQAQHALGQTDAARAALQEAETEAGAMGMRWVLWQVWAAQARLESAAGNATEALQFLAQARASLTQIADEISNPEYKASLLDRPIVRALFD